ncbi:MAG: hypothetical protein ACLT21_05470 [Oscillospiraceae bacterium]
MTGMPFGRKRGPPRFAGGYKAYGMEKSTLSEDIKTEKRTSNMSYKKSVMPTRKDMVYAISGEKLGKFLSA